MSRTQMHCHFIEPLEWSYFPGKRQLLQILERETDIFQLKEMVPKSGVGLYIARSSHVEPEHFVFLQEPEVKASTSTRLHRSCPKKQEPDA